MTLRKISAALFAVFLCTVALARSKAFVLPSAWKGGPVKELVVKGASEREMVWKAERVVESSLAFKRRPCKILTAEKAGLANAAGAEAETVRTNAQAYLTALATTAGKKYELTIR